mmetsp:Transcript_19273/g.59480  ORF Transcript_19273/g.59480 Transcript_19273/m.59480 type:complete len:246 (+) Transcript_19273:743-1480(+)
MPAYKSTTVWPAQSKEAWRRRSEQLPKQNIVRVASKLRRRPPSLISTQGSSPNKRRRFESRVGESETSESRKRRVTPAAVATADQSFGSGKSAGTSKASGPRRDQPRKSTRRCLLTKQASPTRRTSAAATSGTSPCWTASATARERTGIATVSSSSRRMGTSFRKRAPSPTFTRRAADGATHTHAARTSFFCAAAAGRRGGSGELFFLSSALSFPSSENSWRMASTSWASLAREAWRRAVARSAT